MVKKTIKLLAIIELLILSSYFVSFDIYINLQIASLSSFLVIVGSSFAYKKMVTTKLSANMIDEQRDLLDTIDDPHELYDEEPINDAPEEELDLQQVVKDERKKIKTFSTASLKKGLKGGTSLFRLLPYLFLILGFIALKNNNLLDIAIYLPALLVGIVVGSVVVSG